MAKFRGHRIYFDAAADVWRYRDNDGEVAWEWKGRPCGECGLASTPEGHDGCLGTLPGVANACCGHGVTAEAYLQFPDGTRVAGAEALTTIYQLQGKSDGQSKRR